MNKNVAGQKLSLFAFTAATNLPKTGDSANLTAYVSIDDGAVNALTDAAASEVDATKAPGVYKWDLTAAETNGDKLLFSGKSTTAGVVLVPQVIYTWPPYFSSFPLTAAAAISVTSALEEDGGILTLVRGDDYTPDTNGTIVFTWENHGTTVDGNTVAHLVIYDETSSAAVIEKQGAITAGTDLVLSFPLVNTETDDLIESTERYTYGVRVRYGGVAPYLYRTPIAGKVSMVHEYRTIT